MRKWPKLVKIWPLYRQCFQRRIQHLSSMQYQLGHESIPPSSQPERDAWWKSSSSTLNSSWLPEYERGLRCFQSEWLQKGSIGKLVVQSVKNRSRETPCYTAVINGCSGHLHIMCYGREGKKGRTTLDNILEYHYTIMVIRYDLWIVSFMSYKSSMTSLTGQDITMNRKEEKTSDTTSLANDEVSRLVRSYILSQWSSHYKEREEAFESSENRLWCDPHSSIRYREPSSGNLWWWQWRNDASRTFPIFRTIF